MRYLSDPTFPPGRVEVRKDNTLIAAAPVGALVLISYALVVGDELRANPLTMISVRAWERRDAKRRAAQ